MVTLAEFLSKNGVFVVMVSSMTAKRNRDTLDLSWNKNDIKDAWNVTDCMKQGKILYFAYPNNPYGDMKRLMTIYNRLSKERGIYKIRLQNNVLCMTFPEFTKVYPEVDGLVPMTILERYTLPENICKVSEEVFMKDVVNHSGPSARKIKLKTIYKLTTRASEAGKKVCPWSTKQNSLFTGSRRFKRSRRNCLIKSRKWRKIALPTNDCKRFPASARFWRLRS